ncbi:MAG: HAMP domain-containing histidine kinase [Planctomycetes bacterium]|nr:HAMP domain-containing histidine kinase [Planctomycetota bacterium]
MRLKQWSLDRLWAWWATGLILLLFVPSGLFLTYSISRSVERNLAEKGRFFAQAIAAGLIESVLLEDRIRMHEILRDAVADEPGVRYASILDSHGQMLAHSFKSGYPPALVKLWNQHTESVIRYNAGADKLLDVSVSLMSAHQSRLHVGVMRNEAVQASQRVLIVLSLVSTAALCLVLMGTRLIGTLVSRPLQQLETAVSHYPRATALLHSQTVHGTREVVTLTQGFRDMVARLESLEDERTSTQASLIHAERLSAIGELAAGLAHEIRNPLDGMMECVRLLDADTIKSEKAIKYYPMLSEGLERISRTMQSMLVLARSGQQTTVGACQASGIVDELQLLVQPQVHDSQVKLTWDKAGPCVCVCDRQGLLQAGLNLILNSIDAVEDAEMAGLVHVRSYCDDRWVFVSVEDNGQGVPDDLRERIFDPFMSTKPVGKGTGLGLSVSRQLIRAVGGELSLVEERSALGGALFLIRLPKHALECGCDDP